jgi:hypothetical protein
MHKGLDPIHVVGRLLIEQFLTAEKPRERSRKRERDLYGVINSVVRKGPKISPNSHESLNPALTRLSLWALAFKRHQNVKYGVKAGIIGGDGALTTAPSTTPSNNTEQ